MLTDKYAGTSKSINEAIASNAILVFTCWGCYEGKHAAQS